MINSFGLAQSDLNGVFNWKVACSNGVIVPLNAQGRVLALQDLPAGTNSTCLGVYDRSGGTFVPLFEERLPINNRNFVSEAVLNNGTLVVSLNRSNSVTLLGLNSSGAVLWAKQLTSSDFPVASSGPADPGRAVLVSELGTNNILLSLSASQNVGTTNAVTVLISLDSSGSIQWSKKLQIPLVDSPASSAGSQIFVTPSGEVVVTTTDYDLQGTTVIDFTHLTKVAADGTLAWSRKFTGGFIANAVQLISSQGSFLLDLISVDPSGSHSVCGILSSSSGQVTSLVQVDPLGPGRVRPQAVSVSAGKIYFAGNSGSTPVIASSSLSLTNFTAKEYVKGPFNSEVITVLQDGDLAFVGIETNQTTSHLVLLNPDLTEKGGCQLFSASSLKTSPSSFTVATNLFTLADIAVTNASVTLSLISTQLQFIGMSFQEQALCTTNCEYSFSPGGASLDSGAGSTNVNVTVTSLSTCSWGVINPCPDWITVSPMNGVGSAQLTLGVSYNFGNPRSCTLTIGGQPFTVIQAGDIRVLADAVDAPNLAWTTGGDADWIGQTLVTHDGVDAGQSGTITNNQESWMETTVQGPGVLTFWWKVSSQAGSDRLRFMINGIAQNNINGEVDWKQMTYPLASGANVLRWRYFKDASGSAGQDRGWVDQVVWTPATNCSFSLSSGVVGAGPDGGNANVDIAAAVGANCDWSVFNPCADWLTVSPTNGTGNGQVTITASANTSGSTRSCTLTVAGNAVTVLQAAVSSGNLLVQYDPTGAQNSGTPVPPSLVAAGITASSLQEVGLETTWNNTDTLPVGRITTSPNADLSQYLSFTVQSAGGQPITFQSLSYDKQSYLGAGPTHASLRASLDSFGSDIAIVSVNPGGFQSLNFDLSTVPAASTPVTFRIYFYGAPSLTDWADLVSDGKTGNGLRLNGTLSASTPVRILVSDPAFGFAGGKFGFNVTGPSGKGVVIESSTDLQHWAPVQTNAFGAGPLYFNDAQSGLTGARFYRARLQ